MGPTGWLNVLKQCAGVPEKTVKSELSRCGSDELQLIHRAVCEHPQPQARMLKPSGAMSVSTECFPRGLVMSKPSTLVAQAAWTPLKIFRIASHWTTESPVHEPARGLRAGLAAGRQPPRLLPHGVLFKASMVRNLRKASELPRSKKVVRRWVAQNIGRLAISVAAWPCVAGCSQVVLLNRKYRA
ncbi:hypothetical protein BDP67DRAFT_566524 [Colletotrichum lupini]|nr:hypothetical protein BDP67DRAFT_566524 [Colletotrichum lupini]